MASNKHVTESCWRVLMTDDNPPLTWSLTITADDAAGAMAKAVHVFPLRTPVGATLAHPPQAHDFEGRLGWSAIVPASRFRRRRDDVATSQ